MVITNNWCYVKRTMAGNLGSPMAQGITSAESKFTPEFLTIYY